MRLRRVSLAAVLAGTLVSAAAPVRRPTTGRAGDLQARLEGLIEKLGRSPTDGQAAHAELVRIGGPAVPALLTAAEDPLPLRRWWALSALAAIGDPRAVEPLLAHLNDRNNTVRYVAIYHGRAFIRRDPRVAEAITAKLDSADTGDVLWAVRGLGDARYAAALDRLRAAGSHPDREVRWWVLHEALEVDGPGSIPFFAERARSDTEPALRRIALGCLARTGVKDRRTIGAHVGALVDRFPEVRVAAFQGLQDLTGETFDFVAAQDVPREVAAKVVTWWLAARERYPAVGKPGPAPAGSRPAPPAPGPIPGDTGGPP